MGELAALVKKHPEFIGLAVIAVIVIAYLQSRGNGGGGAPSDAGDSVTFTGGGVARPPLDPNAAAIEEARISAGSTNLTTLSQLVLGLNQAQFEKDVQQGQTSAALSASLAQTEAQRHAVDVASSTDISLANINASEQFNALNVTSQMAANASASQLEALRLDNQRQSEINATQRDVSRVQAKSSFWDNVIHGAEGIAALLFA
jgi:hypothetical protein